MVVCQERQLAFTARQWPHSKPTNPQWISKAIQDSVLSSSIEIPPHFIMGLRTSMTGAWWPRRVHWAELMGREIGSCSRRGAAVRQHLFHTKPINYSEAWLPSLTFNYSCLFIVSCCSRGRLTHRRLRRCSCHYLEVISPALIKTTWKAAFFPQWVQTVLSPAIFPRPREYKHTFDFLSSSPQMYTTCTLFSCHIPCGPLHKILRRAAEKHTHTRYLEETRQLN